MLGWRAQSREECVMLPTREELLAALPHPPGQTDFICHQELQFQLFEKWCDRSLVAEKNMDSALKGVML